ncbi:MAG: hypothetical protein HQ518_22380 [Rhodopirellula sp.]|nr:hypothetical protein [Rhodopirellula sp.]
MPRRYRAGAPGAGAVYANRQLTNDLLELTAADINGESRTDTGCEGMDYWHICVLIAARLGCNCRSSARRRNAINRPP